jgi:hypothetical protein
MKGQLLPQFCISLQVNSETAVMAQLSHSSADAGNLDRINPNMNLFQIINHF